MQKVIIYSQFRDRRTDIGLQTENDLNSRAYHINLMVVIFGFKTVKSDSDFKRS